MEIVVHDQSAFVQSQRPNVPSVVFQDKLPTQGTGTPAAFAAATDILHDDMLDRQQTEASSALTAQLTKSENLAALTLQVWLYPPYFSQVRSHTASENLRSSTPFGVRD